MKVKKYNDRKSTIIIAVFAVIGLALVLITKAATNVANIDVGSTAVQPAVTFSDSSASGNTAVRFKVATTGGTGRNYPDHTNINATTFWVGEYFQAGADGSQACSAYVEDWIWNHFRLAHAVNCQIPNGMTGRAAGCDAKLANENGRCDSENSIGSLRTPANGYFPTGLQQVYENPFYLDLPYNDYGDSGGGFTTGYTTRCQDIPWANDPGYAGKCTNRSFSYMKNRWVKIWANGKTCYGQIEDAGPADVEHGNGNYADRNYVFGSNDARPFNTSYNDAGMDISPALNACLGGTFNNDLNVNWEFVDDVGVPAGPWKTVITTGGPTW